MPQYSSTATTPSGIVINTVYDTDADTLTYTATAQNGTTVTATQQTTPSASAAISSDTTNTLFAGLNADGANLGTPSGFLGTLRSTQTAVKTQSSEASRAAQATNTPVPDAPAPPLSTNNQADPAVAPAANNTPPIENTIPAAVPTSSDPAQQQQAAIINADNTAPAQVSTFSDPAQRAQAAIVNADNTAPAQVSTFSDPAQRAQAADQTAIDQAATTNNVQDPSQRAQAREVIENYKAPAVDQTDAETARLARQNEIVQNSAPAANPMGQDPAQRAAAKENVESSDPNQNPAASNKTGLRNTQSQATDQNTKKFKAQEDWRVRLSLAPGADYLYKVGQNQAGILNPLQATDGVIFPYTPAISVAYNAGYDATDITHSNYKFFTYKNSAVDTITLTGDFTAQDTTEANYLLAVIHFFRSVTKMFYGKDQNPKLGTPPPLCYLSGLGAFQFDWHPLVITNFTYTLPTDVDYIRAMDASGNPGVNTSSGQPKGKPGENPMAQRMAGGSLQSGALAAPPNFTNNQSTPAVTYVPTKMSITITANPIITRNDVSNNFSLKDYATGKLLRGSQRNSGGFW